MGALVSTIMSNDVDYVVQLFQEFRKQPIQNLIENDRFWTLASIVRSNPRALAEVRASVISLLEDDLRASSLLLDILVPPQSADVAAQRQALLAVIKLHSVASILRSRTFYDVLFDRTFLEKALSIWRSELADDPVWRCIYRLCTLPDVRALLGCIGPSKPAILRALLADLDRLYRLVFEAVNPIDRRLAPAPPSSAAISAPSSPPDIPTLLACQSPLARLLAPWQKVLLHFVWRVCNQTCVRQLLLSPEFSDLVLSSSFPEWADALGDELGGWPSTLETPVGPALIGASLQRLLRHPRCVPWLELLATHAEAARHVMLMGRDLLLEPVFSIPALLPAVNPPSAPPLPLAGALLAIEGFYLLVDATRRSVEAELHTPTTTAPTASSTSSRLCSANSHIVPVALPGSGGCPDLAASALLHRVSARVWLQSMQPDLLSQVAQALVVLPPHSSLLGCFRALLDAPLVFSLASTIFKADPDASPFSPPSSSFNASSSDEPHPLAWSFSLLDLLVSIVRQALDTTLQRLSLLAPTPQLRTGVAQSNSGEGKHEESLGTLTALRGWRHSADVAQQLIRHSLELLTSLSDSSIQALSLLGSAPLVPSLLDALDWLWRQPSHLDSKAVVEAAVRLLSVLLQLPTWRSLIDCVSLSRTLLLQILNCFLRLTGPPEATEIVQCLQSFLDENRLSEQLGALLAELVQDHVLEALLGLLQLLHPPLSPPSPSPVTLSALRILVSPSSSTITSSQTSADPRAVIAATVSALPSLRASGQAASFSRQGGQSGLTVPPNSLAVGLGRTPALPQLNSKIAWNQISISELSSDQVSLFSSHGFAQLSEIEPSWKTSFQQFCIQVGLKLSPHLVRQMLNVLSKPDRMDLTTMSLLMRHMLESGLSDSLLDHLPVLLFFVAAPYTPSSALLRPLQHASVDSLPISPSATAHSGSPCPSPVHVVGQKLLAELRRRPLAAFLRAQSVGSDSVSNHLFQLVHLSLPAFQQSTPERQRLHHHSAAGSASGISSHLTSHQSPASFPSVSAVLSPVSRQEALYLLLLDLLALQPLARLLLTDRALWAALCDPLVVTDARHVWEATRTAQSITSLPKFLQAAQQLYSHQIFQQCMRSLQQKEIASSLAMFFQHLVNIMSTPTVARLFSILFGMVIQDVLNSTTGRQFLKVVCSVNFWKAFFDSDTVSSVASGRFARLALTRSFESMKQSWRQSSRARTERVRQLLNQFNRSKAKPGLASDPEPRAVDHQTAADIAPAVGGPRALQFFSLVVRMMRQLKQSNKRLRSKL